MPARIAVIGEALVDVFPDREVLGGAPFNVARNLAALGAAPLLATRIGSDLHGVQLLAECARWGLDLQAVQHDNGRATGTVQVRLQADGDHHFEIGSDAAWDHLDGAALLQALQGDAPTWVYSGTLALRHPVSRAAILGAVDRCIERGASCFVDLNLRGTNDDRLLAEAALERADVVKVNAEELEQLLAWFAELPEQLVQRFGIARLVVTRGARGWACFDAALGDWLEGPAVPASVIDTVGAGDAFSAVLLLGQARGWPLQTMLERANTFAARVCGLRGAVDASSPIYAAARSNWAA